MDGGINWTSIRYAAFYARPAIYNIATTTTSTTATATTRLQNNYSYNYNSTTLYYTPLHHTTLQLQLQQLLQLQLWHFNYNDINYNHTTIQLQLHLQLQFHCTTLHHTTSSGCVWGDLCNHSKKHNSKHLSIHQWVRSAFHDSQQPTFARLPIETSATALCDTTGVLIPSTNGLWH